MRRKKLVGPAEWPGRPLVVVDGVCVWQQQHHHLMLNHKQMMCVCERLPSFSTSALCANTGGEEGDVLCVCVCVCVCV